MITTDYCNLKPAYGRLYRSAADVRKDFLDGKDFMILPNGQYVSIRDFAPGVTVNLAYGAGNRRVAPTKVPVVGK